MKTKAPFIGDLSRSKRETTVSSLFDSAVGASAETVASELSAASAILFSTGEH